MKSGIKVIGLIIIVSFFGSIMPSQSSNSSSEDFGVEDELLASIRPRSSYLPAYWAQKIHVPLNIKVEDVDSETEQELITHDNDETFAQYRHGCEQIYLQNAYGETLICKIDDQEQQTIGQGGRLQVGSLWQKIPNTSIRRNKYTSFFTDITPLLYAQMLTDNPITLTSYLLSLKKLHENLSLEQLNKHRRNLIIYIEPSSISEPWKVRSEWERIPHSETVEDIGNIEENWQEMAISTVAPAPASIEEKKGLLRKQFRQPMTLPLRPTKEIEDALNDINTIEATNKNM